MTPRFSCPLCRVELIGETNINCPRCGFALHREDGIWRDDSVATPTGFDTAAREHLHGIEEKHFWFAPRDRLLREIAQRELPAGGAALELGCGSGRLLRAWDAQFSSCTALEAHAQSLLEAGGRGSDAMLLQADVGRLPLADDQFDALMAFDVLEHADPVAMLGEARRVARRGARLLLSVPAYQSLWSYADELAGHRCRYDRALLARELRASGWRLRGHTHYQFALFPLLWLSRRLLGARARRAEREPAAFVAAILGRINAMEVRLFSRWRLPFGSSLIVWAEAA